MDNPAVALTESGASKWQEILRAAGFEVQLDEVEVKRCEELGMACKKTGHLRLISTYPYKISRTDVQLRLIEVRQHDGYVGLAFMPLKSRKEKQLFNQIQQTLITSGAVEEKVE